MTTPQQIRKAKQLTRLWREALADRERQISDVADQIEQDAYDELVDYIEANDLNGTSYDPRGTTVS